MKQRTLGAPQVVGLAAAIILFLLAAVTPWFFGGVEARYQLVVGPTLALVLLLAALRPSATAAALRAIRRPLLLIFAAIALGGFQLTHAAFSLADRFDPRVGEIREYFRADAAVEPSSEARPPLSVAPAATRRDMALLIYAAAAFVAGALFFSGTRAFLALAAGLAVLGGAIALFGIYQQLRWEDWQGRLYGFVPLTRGGQPFGPFVNRNNCGGFLLLCLAGAICRLVWQALNVPPIPENERTRLTLRHALAADRRRSDSPTARGFVWFMANLNAPLLASGAVLILIVGGVFASLSRGSMVAMAAAGAATLACTALWSRRTALLWVVVAALVAGAGVVAWVGQSDAVRQRLATLFDPEKIGHESRWEHWRVALRTAGDYRTIGAGLGTYRYVYPLHNEKLSQLVFRHAENQYIEAFVVGGAVGAVLLFGSLALFSWNVIRLLRYARTSTDYAVAACGLFVLFGQALQACFDFSLYMPANMLTMAVLCGALSRRAAACRDGALAEESRTRLSPWARGAALFVVFLLLASLAWAFDQTRRQAACEIAEKNTRRTQQNAAHRDEAWLEAAVAEQARAVALAPDDGETRMRLAELLIERYAKRLPRAVEETIAADPELSKPANATLQQAFRRAATQMQTPMQLHARAAMMARTPMLDDHGRPIDELTPLRNVPVVAENLAPALRELRAALRANPLLPYAYVRLAELCFLDESPLNDRGYLERAERLSSGRDDWLFEIGALHLDAGRLEPAFKAWQRSWYLAVRFDPVNAPAREEQIMRVAVGYLEPEEMLAKLVPQDPEIYARLARRYFTVEEPPPAPAAALKAGEATFQPAGRRVFYSAAVEAYGKQPPTDGPGLFALGSALAELGEFAAAETEFRKALEIDHRRTDWRIELAAVLFADGRDPEADGQLQAAATLAAGESVDRRNVLLRAWRLVKRRPMPAPEKAASLTRLEALLNSRAP